MDNGSAKPVDMRVLDAMTPYFSEIFGNPASYHSEGFKALNAMRIARKQVAELVNSDPDEIVFTLPLDRIHRQFKRQPPVILGTG